MENNKNQALLYKYRNEIKQSLSKTEIGSARYKYLFNFLKRHNSLFIFVLIFLFLQTILEITLLILVNNSIKDIFVNVENHSNIWFAVVILICCVAYTILTFLSVRYERTLVLNLINDLRKKLFANNLEMEAVENTHEKRSDFLSKISFHLSLLTMGIDNTLISMIRWILYIVIILVFSIVNTGTYIYLVGIVFISSIALFFIAYFVSKKYITRQVASYSKILRHITTTLLDIPLIKNLHLEKSAEKKLDRIVSIDTYFRIIRDTWIRYSSRVVFILIIAFGALYMLLSSYYPVFTLEKSSQFLIKGIFYIYVVRILFSSIKAGIYFLPLKLGIFLSIPEKFNKTVNPRTNWQWKKIIFKSNKVKLFNESDYFKKITIEFNQGGRYLFIGDYQSGKSHLAAIFAGVGYFSRHSWITKVDNEHLGYNHWCEIFKDNYYFLPNFSTDLTVGEIILGKECEEIKENDIDIVNKLSEKYPIFLSILSKTRFTGESARRFESSPVSLFAIQVAYCILNKPKIIIIDNAWVDLSYNQIDELIQILNKELPKSIIIIFSRKNNSILAYEYIYEIKKTTIQKI